MDVLMPQLGETVAEGKITAWLKSVGDRVAPGDNLFEIETDKTSMDVPAVSGGTLVEIRVGQGEVVPVGAVVAVIGEAASAAVASEPTLVTPIANASVSGAAVAPAAVAGNAQAHILPRKALDPFAEVRTPERNWGPRKVGNVSVSPLARRLAGLRGIDLSRVQGTGPRGRIVSHDIENAAAPATHSSLALNPPVMDIKAFYRDAQYEEIALDAMRNTIAARLALAKKTIPHFYLTSDIDVAALLEVRNKLIEATLANGEKPSVRISLNDFIIKALALALQRVPAANAVWAEDRILRFSQSDIGVAVAVGGGGVITPVIRNANNKSLSAISGGMQELAERARARRLSADECRGGASAVSNLGMYGVREFAAIINPPQSTILAVGATYRAPVEGENGSVHFTDRMTVTLSCDHRVMDGVAGAQVLQALKTYLEQPLAMLV